jgi:hypothetical protein
VAELRRCAGTQFDPVVVDALVSALAERDFDLAVAAPAVGALRLHPEGENVGGFRVGLTTCPA